MKSGAAEYFRKLSPLKGGSPMYENGSYGGKSGRCHCCPYGYHIDLDFVRYCQALNQGAKNDNPALIELKRMKKARRRQTKSMEAMLGLSPQEEHKTWLKDSNFITHSINHETRVPSFQNHGSSSPIPPPREKRRIFTPPSPPPRKHSLTHPALRLPPPPDIINSSSLLLNRRNEAASDALQEAMLDFEETLESSKDYPRRKSRLDGYQPYYTIDLLHHTSPQSSHHAFSNKSVKPSGVTVGRSNSLPRQFLHESPSFSRYPSFNYKEPIGITQSFTSYNGYQSQSPLICDAMTTLNAAQGYSAYRTQDFDTMSVTSAMSGVSTTTLQSIRDQMATGLSRLKDLEEEVKGLPTMQTKMNILKEEKRILVEQLQCLQRGVEPSPAPISLERDSWADTNAEELETRLDTLRRFIVDDRRRTDRKRSLSPMRVNLQDFHSYRRARRGSLSEGSDSESVHSYRGCEKNRERDDTHLYISETNDQFYSDRISPVKKSSFSLPSTPMVSRKGMKDAAVGCRILTRDVGISHVPPRSRSIGTLTDKLEDSTASRELDRKKEVKAKPCLQCFRRNQKTFQSRSVGTTSPKRDSGSYSTESLGLEELDLKLPEQDLNAKNTLLQKLGKKSPIISRLSSPQLFPPALTFDNSTNTEPMSQRDERLNTVLGMDDLFSREQLNELIEDAKKQWEVTHMSKISPPKEPKKPLKSDRGIQTTSETPFKRLLQNAGVMVKPTTRDTGVGYLSIDFVETKVPPRPQMRSVACGGETPWEKILKENAIAKKSVAVGEFRLSDTTCADCANRKKSLIHPVRSIGCGDGRISDLVCDKCRHINTRSVGVGDARVTEDRCKKCQLKRTSSTGCQVQPLSRSVSIEVNLPFVTTPKEPSLASTPEVERRPFGSSGVRICDKCHEAITSVAKDIVSITGPSPSSAVINQASSKIPRLVESPQKVEQKFPPKTSDLVQLAPASYRLQSTLNLPLKESPPKSLDPDVIATPAFSFKMDKTVLKVEEKPSPVSSVKKEEHSASSSTVSSTIASLGTSPQVKRVPYNRQETYTKIGDGAAGFVNPAFEELAYSKLEVDQKSKGKISSPIKTEVCEKPLGEREKPAKIEEEKPLKESKEEPVIKGKAEKKSPLSSSSSSSSSSEDEDEISVVGSSLAAEESISLRTSSDTVGKPRQKAQPSRGMRAALKVLNDSIGKPVRSGQQLSNAINIIQKEWFKISSQKDADPLAVEEYMDAFEEYSKGLLQRVVNLADINGNTAMHYAVSHGNFDVVSVLLNSKVCNINHQNKAGYTAIMLVALAQIRNDAHESVVKKLFESGDVNIKASQHGQTGLMLAVSHGRLDMVRMLSIAGANPNIQDEDGSTALMCAAEHGHLAIVRYLVAQPDTDLYLMDNDGSTALTIAVEAGHKDVGVLLYKQMNLSRGSSPYSSVRGGKRPRTPTMVRSSITPPPRSSAPSSPGRSRKSSGRVSPAHARQSSASLSNLIL